MHVLMGFLPPSSTSPMASSYLKELKSEDAPPVPIARVPVCLGVTQLYALTHDMTNIRNRLKATAQKVGSR